ILEVIQLMKVMDTMLEKAGVDDEQIGITGPSQLHNVLEVLKTEQNIYNIVFHELIRQVSVDCAERGELLSKQRYVNLLDRIPQQMRNLYKEMMAQRVMDRHITEELYNFKESVGQLTSELCEVREHDFRVTREAERAHEELADAVRDAELNANLVEEYRELYELQRARLETQLLQLTQEKEIWSSATYDLAMKDTADLSDLQEMTEQFRELLDRIGVEVEHAENSSREKLRMVQNGLTKWMQYFQDNLRAFSGMTCSLLSFQMLNEDLEQYGGEVLLMKKETLKTAANLQKRWTELGQTVLSRHKDINGVLPPELRAMEEINERANELCQQYSVRINGENGKKLPIFVILQCISLPCTKVTKLTLVQRSASSAMCFDILLFEMGVHQSALRNF
uniref:Axonemal dynein light chain domain containing 1 n=1 Tax=Terrapene triunguis TaxID=2587831 RepID=A0A674JB49_9SAUR